MKVQKKRSVGIANWFYFFIFSGPRSRPFLQELPNCTSLPCVPCYPQSLIFFLLDCWSKPLGYLHLAHIANDSPLSCHLQWLKRQRSPRGAVRRQSSKPSGLFPSRPLLPGHTPPTPTSSARENQAGPLPRQRRRGATLLVFSLANLAHLVAGTEASDQRECSHEVFFFPLCPLRQVDYFKPKFPGLQEQHKSVPTSPLPSPAHPGPSHPRAGPLYSCPAAFGQLFKGPGAFVKVGCRHAGRRLFLLLFCFFQPTLEQREKPGSTHKQIQSKETERQRFRGRSPERWRQGGRMPQMARPLNGWNHVFSHSLTLG